MALSGADLARPVIKAKAGVHAGNQVLRYRNGVCPFLNNDTDRCKVYDERPEVCRAFDCRGCRPEGAFLCGNPYAAAALRDATLNGN